MKKKPIPTKRNGIYYIKWLDTTEKNIGVTEVLKAVAKPALQYWTGKEAAKAALADPNLTEDEVMAAVRDISKKAMIRGTTVHSLTEASDNEGVIIEVNKVWPEVRGYLKAFNKFKADMKPKLLYNEQTVFNRNHKYGGTVDRIYKIDDKVVLLDIKTSKDFYPVLLGENGTYAVKEMPDVFEVFLNLKAVWEFMNPDKAKEVRSE
jgi:hypothetical protein